MQAPAAVLANWAAADVDRLAGLLDRPVADVEAAAPLPAPRDPRVVA